MHVIALHYKGNSLCLICFQNFHFISCLQVSLSEAAAFSGSAGFPSGGNGESTRNKCPFISTLEHLFISGSVIDMIFLQF